jgi:hypothetical protein
VRFHFFAATGNSAKVFALLGGRKRRMIPAAGEQAMRYVIGICIVAGFLIWDAGYNEGRYISYTVMELKRLTAMVGA